MVSHLASPPGFTADAALDAIYGPGAAQRTRDARILVVGAGGVGCELVKNLACTGFGSITMIDMDTIDVSNLNRQFLFRKRHVGKSKAVEAAASISQMVSGTKVEGIVGNIKEARFGVPFYKGFTVVCNALDNLEARRHVNRMCLAADVPLIESGSTGYTGQSQVIGNGVECYDCKDKVKQKSYAVCTIRSTPEKPVHCIVWAKYLFDLMFGPDDDGNVLKDLDTVPSAQANGTHVGEAPESSPANGNATEKANGAEEINGKPSSSGTAESNGTAEDIRKDSDGAPETNPRGIRFAGGETSETFASRVCKRVFVDDIKTQIAMKDLWKKRDPPVIFDVNAAADGNGEDIEKIDLLSQSEWNKEKSAAVFKATIRNIADKRNDEIGALTFDKDDQDAMMFVSAASNLRSHAYGVELLSPFAIKGIAGNIIHAIATTNAMVGGLIVLEALKVTANQGKLDKCLNTYVVKLPAGSRVQKLLISEKLMGPNKQCFVCSKGQLHLCIDLKKTTLRMLVQSVLQKRMSVIQPCLHVTTGDFNNTLYESGAGLEEDEIETYKGNLKKKLSELRVEEGSQLVVEDFAQNFSCTVHVSDGEGQFDDAAEGEEFLLDGKVPEKQENGTTEKAVQEEATDVDIDEAVWQPTQQKRDGIEVKQSDGGKEEEENDEEVMVVPVAANAGTKRRHDEATNGEAGAESSEPVAKRVREKEIGDKE